MSARSSRKIILTKHSLLFRLSFPCSHQAPGVRSEHGDGDGSACSITPSLVKRAP